MIYTPYLLRTWTSINREVRSKTTFISWQPMSPVGNVPTAKCACRIDNYVVKCDGRTFSIKMQGHDVRRGDINFRYLPPFAFLLGENSTLIRDGNFGHRFAVLVYQQPFRKRVTWPKEDNWCSSKGVFGRLRVNNSSFP